jgi:Rad3-related DNA helicase
MQCGLGKTLIGLEFGRHVVHRTGKRVLIVTRNEIVREWLEQARFYVRRATRPPAGSAAGPR